MATKLEQRQLFILENEVMNGFCYSFSKLLLEKLKELKEGKRLVDINHLNVISGIGLSVSYSLSKQIEYRKPIDFPEDCEELIKVAEEFLVIFEKEEG